MKVTFAAFQAEMPDGWRDESTITYTMPPTEDLRIPLAGGKQPASPANIVINWQESAADATVFLSSRIAELRASLPGFKILAQGDVDGIPFVEYAFSLQIALVQVLYVRKLGDYIVTVTGTASPSIFESVRGEFARAVRSIT